MSTTNHIQKSSEVQCARSSYPLMVFTNFKSLKFVEILLSVAFRYIIEVKAKALTQSLKDVHTVHSR
jgi:hypothetical protein